MILAGGTEALSHAPLVYSREATEWYGDLARAKSPLDKVKAMAEVRPDFFSPVIGLERGLTDPITSLNMGQTAEVLADRFNISREAADAYAVRSHQRLSRATAEGFLVEMEPIFDDRGNLYDHDDGVRPDSTVERLGRLRPVFEPPWGKVTAGNSSQITDGAAWLILASESAVNRYGLEPLGRISGSQWSALDPAQMGLGPAHASAALMQRHRLGVGDIDAWELNEAFAAQVLACLKVWKDDAYCRDQLGLEGALGEIDPERLNVDGGAISLGHPGGTSGARITLHLLHVLRRLGGRRGIATLCIGGGQGGALLVERP